MPELDAQGTVVVDQSQDSGSKGAPAAGGDRGAAEPASIPAYLAGASAEQKKELAARIQKGWKPPEKFTDFLASHLQQEAKLSSAILVPAKDAPAAEWDNYWKQRGVPETDDGYALERPTGLPEGVRYSEEMEKWFKTTSRKYRLTPDQAKGLFKDYNELQIGAAKQILEKQKAQATELETKKKADVAAADTALRQAWGVNYEANRAGALQTLTNKNIVPEGWANKLKAAGLDTDPETLVVLQTLWKATKDDAKIWASGESGETGDEDVDPKTGRHVIRHPKTRARYKGSSAE